MALDRAQAVCTFCGESNPVSTDARASGPTSVLPRGEWPDLGATTTIQNQSTPVATGIRREPICPRCGKDNSRVPNARFCFTCGTTLPPLQEKKAVTPSPALKFCPFCGKSTTLQPKNAKYCLYCGKPVIGSKTTEIPGPSQARAEKEVKTPPPPQPALSSAAPPEEKPPVVEVSRAEPETARLAADRKPEAIPDPVASPAKVIAPADAIVIPAGPTAEPLDMLKVAGRYEAPVLSVAFSKDGSVYFVGTARNEIVSRMTTNAREKRIIKGDREEGVITAILGTDGGGLATCMNGTVMRFRRLVIRRASVGNIPTRIESSQRAILSVAASPSGKLLLLGGYDAICEIWNLENGKLVHTLPGHSVPIDAVAFDPTGCMAATGSRDGVVRLWKIETGESVGVLSGHANAVHALAFSPDLTSLASGFEDGSIMLWNLEQKTPMGMLNGHRDSVLALAFNNDGTYMVSGGADTIARVWDMKAMVESRQVENHAGAITAIAISPDGHRVITGGADKCSYHWYLPGNKK